MKPKFITKFQLLLLATLFNLSYFLVEENTVDELRRTWKIQFSNLIFEFERYNLELEMTDYTFEYLKFNYLRFVERNNCVFSQLHEIFNKIIDSN